MPTGFRDGNIVPYGSQRILQRAPFAHVHVNIATRDEWQPKLAAYGLERAQPLFVRAVEEQLDGDTDLGPKSVT
jgi:hypothetical protein